MNRFIVVGGVPFYNHMNRGTITFTNIKVVGHCKTKTEADMLANENYDECGGLVHIIDTELRDVNE